MKISLEWLAEYVEFLEEDPQKISDAITAHTAEVDEVEVQGALLDHCCVGKILTLDKHPNADKLYKMQVDFGAEKRQVLAGIKPYYKPAELLGKQAVFIVNLEPRKIRGEESQAMILAAESGKDVAFIAPTNKNIKPGSKIH